MNTIGERIVASIVLFMMVVTLVNSWAIGLDVLGIGARHWTSLSFGIGGVVFFYLLGRRMARKQNIDDQCERDASLLP